MIELNFLELLINKEIISYQTAKELDEKFQNDHFAILLHLKDSRIASKEKLGRLWGDSLEIAYTDLKKAMFKKEIVEKLPEEFARKNKIILIYQLNKAITAATCNPKNDILLNKIEQMTKFQISPTFSFPEDIDEAIDKHYIREDSLGGLIKQFSIDKKRINIEELPSAVSSETKEYLVNNTKNIVQQAQEGKLPDVTLCNNVGSAIAEEVDKKLGVVQCINQLRVIDEFAYSHSVNVAMLSAAVGKTLGYGVNVVKELTLGALLHDIGKIQAANEEQKHPLLGYQIIKNMGLPERIAEVAYNHHERIDRNGYPRGVGRDEVSLYSQIVAIVDVYDILVSDRPPHEKLSPHEALNLMLLQGYSALNFELLYKFANIVYKENIDALKKTFNSVLYGENY
ncbi:MAG: hypothetical protein A2Y25_03205 [Candidatus Melainabacteria bacterium GWF2_37_15]|nr:MAG: hypothetical protein A2Y25_03205 [Candidatus Melainabacteria bacterium GWF2_37_15]